MSSVSLINGHIDDDIPRMTPQESIEFIKNEVQIDVRFCDKKDIEKTEEAFELAISALEKLADLVEVVRCKDCKYYDDGECTCHSEPHDRIYERWTVDVYENDYCSYGERRDKK